MSELEKDVLKYTVLSMINLSKNNREYNFDLELNKFKESVFYNNINLANAEKNQIIEEAILNNN